MVQLKIIKLTGVKLTDENGIVKKDSQGQDIVYDRYIGVADDIGLKINIQLPKENKVAKELYKKVLDKYVDETKTVK